MCGQSMNIELAKDYKLPNSAASAVTIPSLFFFYCRATHSDMRNYIFMTIMCLRSQPIST